MKYENDVYKRLQDLQTINITTPYHQEKLRKHLVTLHALQKSRRPPSSATIPFLLRIQALGVSKKILSVSIAVVSAVILALGMLLLFPFYGTEPYKKSVAGAPTETPREHQDSAPVSACTHHRICHADDRISATPPPSSASSPPQHAIAKSTNVHAAVVASPSASISAPHSAPHSSPPIVAAEAEPSILTTTLDIISPLASVNVALISPEEDANNAKKDKAEKQKEKAAKKQNKTQSPH